MSVLKTIAKVGYAGITARSSASYTYESSVSYFESGQAGGRNISVSPRGDSYEIFADGVSVIAGDINDGYDIELELLSFIDDIEKDWLGNTKLSSGVLEKVETAERPHFALVVAKERHNASTKYEVDIYYDCQVSKRPNRTAKTAEKNFDPDFPTFPIAALPRLDNRFVKYTLYTDTLPTSIVTPTIPETPASP